MNVILYETTDQDAVDATELQRLEPLSACRMPGCECTPEAETRWKAAGKISQASQVPIVEAIQVIKR